MQTLADLSSFAWFGMPGYVWLGFIALVLVLLVIDLGLFHRKPHEVGITESLGLSVFFITIGLGFSVIVGAIYFNQDPSLILDPHLSTSMKPFSRGWHAGELYLTGYLIEQSLSLDNIFIMSRVFA